MSAQDIVLKNDLINDLTNGYGQQALTEIEALGLASRYDLANGHASQDLTAGQQKIIDMLPQLWTLGTKQRSRDAELAYKDAFQKLASTPSLTDYDYFKVCPTASNSIDVVAAWLAEKKLLTALVEPTFDNLYLILKRRGVSLKPLPEAALVVGDWAEALAEVDAVFLVNPNNPTGTSLSAALLTDIASWCATNRKVIILDNTFRFFVAQDFDVYRILADSGVTFLSIEDTGKVWPTQEIKASLLFCSANIFREIHVIYDEIFLCVSNFALAILSKFLLDAYENGLANTVWSEVAARRKLFRAAIAGTALAIHPLGMESKISVEWVQITGYFASDLELASHFKIHNLILLPGRQFYWSHQGSAVPADSARFALLKSGTEFTCAVEFLAGELRRLK